MTYPAPTADETAADYLARCLHYDGRTAAEIRRWTDADWVEFQTRVLPSAGARTDGAFRLDQECRLGLLTGEYRSIS